ncbi:phosphotransferase family protein [Mycolicibacterium helvum]|uniref:Putative phosphotransferase n=1 Tax=Mycolicibacterium helvum TaxID=1534349 RepID=A0A7I7TBD2_9MYCO|nr:phosphotransferase family protein [Mycolicibacterium helvum]BBY65791.1 putative phosphotransferase [Mycolicibacterium helvum]
MALKNTIDTQEAAARLARWLTSRTGGAQPVRVTDLVVPESAGMSNETVLFTAEWPEDGQDRRSALVARVQPDGPGVFPAYDLSKEARVLQALGSHTDVPVPTVHFYEQAPDVFGSPFLVMERVDGQVPSDDPPFTAGGWVLDLTASQRKKMWHNSIDVLGSIHAVDWQALGLQFLDDADDAVRRQIDDWRGTFAWAAEGEANPTIEHALEWLADHVPTPAGPKVLNWGDARVGNIIFAADLTPAAVLDWEMVTVAPREVDLGWWLFLMRHHTDGIGLPLPEGIPTRAETVAHYQAGTGFTPADLDYYEVLAATKLSIIMVRAAHMMIAMGLLPQDSPMALSNPASQLLAQLLELPAPNGLSTSFIGNR